ncbi:MAG TPA: AMP-binding protein [Candidatus Binataceae bacterium]|nr:AMP-binding protein [Candidatus Binataceae bacterium]
MAEQTPTPAQILVQRAAATPNRVFIMFEDQRVTFGQMNERVNRVANGLAKLGVKPGDGVAIIMPNRPEWLYSFFAIQKLCCYSVPVNIALKGEGLAYILNHSEAKAVIVASELFDAFAAIRPSLTSLRHVIVDTTEAPDFAVPPGAVTLAKLAADAPASEVNAPIDPAAMACLLYTSGTTGLPKGVVMRYQGLGRFGLFGSQYTDNDILYTCLPLFHANALFLTVVRALAGGLTVGLSRRFSASRFWDEVRRYGATTFNALGAMVPILLKQPPRADDANNPIRMVFSAATPAWAWGEFEKRFNVTIFEGYGAVDGGGFGLSNFGTAPKGSMGKPAPGVEARVVDENGNEVPTGETGNLVFKVDDANQRRVEYLKNNEASNAKIRNGWFFTGDMAYRDADGNFYFADRKTDSMRRRGENISSYEVEKIVNQHPAVLESGAFGVPSELGEDDVMITVVLRPGQSVAPEALVKFCEERMANFMVPRYIDFCGALPKTETHRVQKAVLKKQGVTPTTWDREKTQPARRQPAPAR